MAEFALGLTKTVVEGTVSRVMAAIDEEEKVKTQVQNDLVFITGEFQMMQSFLNVANKERAKNEVVRTWVRQIRDLAFDVEDCVELVVSLDVKSGWSWVWRVLPGCMAPPRPIDEAVAEIQRLKARVEDVSHRNIRYNLINDSGSSSTCNSKHGAVTIVSSPAPAPDLMPSTTIDTCASSSAFDILREVWEDAGNMRPDTSDLRKLITNEGIDLEVISLWGGLGSAADRGKTHVIREAYNDPEICQQFKSRAWVKVMQPFCPEEFLKSLLTQFYASSHRAMVLNAKFKKEMRAAVDEEDDLMKAQLMKQVSDEQRYLVIVEALSTVAEWDTIRMYLPDSKNGSRIVLTTQQLGLALSCTGNPYQVSEIRQFSRGQSLCGFFSKFSGRRTDLGELIWQLRSGGVISVWQFYNEYESSLLDGVYMGITHKSKVFEGVEFKRHNWVDVPDPFDLHVFSRRLFLKFHSDDLRAKEILGAGMIGDTCVIQGCHKFLHADRCLIVINGLSLTDHWNQIKTAFSFELTKCFIIVTTSQESVARYCVDEDNRAFSIAHLNADLALHRSIKACENYGIEASEVSRRGRFFSNRRKQARGWIDKFKYVVDPRGIYSGKLRNRLQHPGVISLYGATAAWESALAREIYYEQMLIPSEDNMHPQRDTYGSKIVDLDFTKYSWVDVPQPFNFIDLCLRLFMDFYSDDPEAKQKAAFNIMEGRQDPIEGCLEFLRQDKSFVVIDGLQARDDWESIEDVFLAVPIKGCILVITNEKCVATHCVHNNEDRVVFAEKNSLYLASHPLIKEKGYTDKDRSHDFASRMIKAREWCKEFELLEHSVQADVRTFIHWTRGCVISVWGIAGVGKSDLVKSIYYQHMMGIPSWGRRTPVTKYSWVDVPQSFNLTDLSRRIFIDFHSDGIETKETAAVGMMEGQDPIQGCREFLRQDVCFLVIDGLRSTDDWDLIKTAFLSEPIKGVILVIANEESIAVHCADKKNEVFNVKGLEAEAALSLFSKLQRFYIY